MGEGTDVKLYCYTDAVDPDYWLLRKKEEGQKGNNTRLPGRLAKQTEDTRLGFEKSMREVKNVFLSFIFTKSNGTT
jgi:hypothetical protein